MPGAWLAAALFAVHPHYGGALDIHALDPDALGRLAAKLFDEGRYEEALALYRRLVRVQPFAAAPRERLGETLRRLGQPAAAWPSEPSSAIVANERLGRFVGSPTR